MAQNQPRARRRAPSASERLTLIRDQRGAVATEYLVLTAMGLAAAIGLGLLGVAMVDGYGTSLQYLYSDIP